MKIGKYIGGLIVFILLIINAFGQKQELDSLINLAKAYKYNDTTKVNLLNKAAEFAYYVGGDYQYFLATEAKELAEQLGYVEGLSEAYESLARHFLVNLNSQEAFKALRKSYELNEQSGDIRRKAQLLNHLGDLYIDFKRDSVEEAIRCFNDAIFLFEQLGDSLNKAIVISSLGNAFSLQGNLIEAIRAYNKALEIQIAFNDERLIAICYHNLGDVYSNLGNNELAIENYKNAFVYYEKNDKVGLCKVYSSLGLELEIQGKLEEAFEYLTKSLELSREFGLSGEIVNSLSYIANFYRRRGQFQEALNSFAEALAICNSDSTGFTFGTYILTKGIARTYSAMGDFNKALASAVKAQKIMDDSFGLEAQKDMNLLFSIIYEKGNHPAQALQYYKKYKSLEDSIFSESNLLESARLESQYENEKEKQALKLEQEKKEALYTAEVKQQKIVRNALIFGFLLIFSLLVVILVSFLQKRRDNKILESQKEKIELQAKKMEEINRKLVELDHFKQGMISMIVHDLKNPLNTILHLSKGEAEENIKVTKQAAGKMLNLVLNILDLNKYENSKMLVRKGAFFIHETAQRAIIQIAHLAGQKNIQIKNEINKLAGVAGDKAIVERIFINLLSNAIKYTPVNGKIEIEDHVSEQDRRIVISVKDSGQGISREFHEKVFEKFMQIDGSHIENVHSSGLGLAFCKLAAEAHDGEIWIDNDYSDGTSVSFSLPLERVHFTEEEVPESKEEKISLTEKERIVLQKYLAKLERLEVYEISSFRKILKEIKNERMENKQWLKQLKNALEYGNQKQFEFLINLIK